MNRSEDIIKELKIEYPTGSMEIDLERFFPCSVDKAKKVFSLIYKYSSKKDKEALLKYFLYKEEQCYKNMSIYAEEASSYPEKLNEHRGALSRFKEARRELQRIKKNKEIFVIWGGTL